jgi:GGDEF domain-containing protein
VQRQQSAKTTDPGQPAGSRLRAIVQSRMWKWIFDAHRLLGVTVEIFDDQLIALVPVSAAKPARPDGEPPADCMPRAIAQSLTTASPLMATCTGVRLSSTPIMSGAAAAGAVVISASPSERIGDRELTRTGLLLASAIEDQLSRPLHEHGDSSHKISALYQLLHAAIAQGSEREVLRTFAEALSIWDEIEVLAYRADLDGRYRLEMLLPGSDPDANPQSFARELFGDSIGLLRVAGGERRELGFLGNGETALIQLATDGGPWLVAMTAVSDPAEGDRSDLYLAALGHALNAAIGVESSRLTWAVMQQFVDSQSPREAAARALVETSTVLNASGGFALFAPNDARVVTVGDPLSIDALAVPRADAGILRAQVAAPAPFRAVLEMRATAGQAFTRREVRLFETALGNFATWLTSATRGLGGGGERRGAVRSFDQILDRYAREAHASNDPASLILISPDGAAASIHEAHAWIKRLRAQLRPTDLAGRLTSGEVGILLLQTPHEGAHIVARRLARTLVTKAAPATAESPVRIGVASQFGETVSGDALIARARLHPLEKRSPPVPDLHHAR